MSDLLTTREIGDLLGQPEWRIRRVADELVPPVSRFGGKRAITRGRIPAIVAALLARGWLPETEVAPA